MRTLRSELARVLGDEGLSLLVPELQKDGTIATTSTDFETRPAVEGVTKTSDPKVAQKSRGKTFGIAVKDGGNVTMPRKWRRLGLKDRDFADPVNYAFPLHDKRHADNAMSRWEAGAKDKYSPKEQGIIVGRIRAAQTRFGEKPMEKTETGADLKKAVTPTALDPTAGIMTSMDDGTDVGDTTYDLAEDDPMWSAMGSLADSLISVLQSLDEMSEAAGGPGLSEDDLKKYCQQFTDAMLALFAKYEGAEDATNADTVQKTAPDLIEKLNFVATRPELSKVGARHSAPDMEHLNAIAAKASEIQAHAGELGAAIEDMQKTALEKTASGVTEPLKEDVNPEASKSDGIPVLRALHDTLTAEDAHAAALQKTLEEGEARLRKITEESQKIADEAEARLRKANEEFDALMQKARPRPDRIAEVVADDLPYEQKIAQLASAVTGPTPAAV